MGHLRNPTYQRHPAWLETETSKDQTDVLNCIAHHQHLFISLHKNKEVQNSSTFTLYTISSPALMPHLRSSMDFTLFVDSKA